MPGKFSQSYHPNDLPLSFSPQELQELIALHTQIAQNFSIQSPYLKHAQGTQNFLLQEKRYLDKLCLKVGPISSFTKEEIAALIQKQFVSYITMGAMGETYPNNYFNNQKLTSFLIDVNPDDIFILIDYQKEDNPNETYTPIASLRLSFSDSQKTLAELNGNHQAKFTTLSLIKNNSNDILKLYQQLRETDIAHLSRVYRLPNQDLENLNFEQNEYKSISTKLFKTLKEVLPQIKKDKKTSHLLLDTTHPRVVHHLQENLDKAFMTDDQYLEPTPLSLQEEILKHHFNKEEWKNRMKVLVIPV